MNTNAQRDAILMLLKEWGYYKGEIDHEFGPLADRAWQSLKTATDKAASPERPSLEGSSPLVRKLIALAHDEIGTKEVGTNNGKRVNEYQSADWLEGGGYAWCASFICWLIREAIKDVSVKFQRPQTAGAWDFERWAKTQENNGVTLIKPPGNIHQGDIIIFKFSHIGLAVEDEKNGSVVTIEGNTNGAGSREGDGVYKKTRAKSSIRSVIRLA